MCSDNDIHEFAQVAKVRYLLCSDWNASIDKFNLFREVLPRSHRVFHDRDISWEGIFPDRHYGTILGLGVEQQPIVL